MPELVDTAETTPDYAGAPKMIKQGALATRMLLAMVLTGVRHFRH